MTPKPAQGGEKLARLEKRIRNIQASPVGDVWLGKECVGWGLDILDASKRVDEINAVADSWKSSAVKEAYYKAASLMSRRCIAPDSCEGRCGACRDVADIKALAQEVGGE